MRSPYSMVGKQLFDQNPRLDLLREEGRREEERVNEERDRERGGDIKVPRNKFIYRSPEVTQILGLDPNRLICLGANIKVSRAFHLRPD